MRGIAPLLLGGGAALLAGLVPVRMPGAARAARRDMGPRRRRVLTEAVGLVHGTERGLRAVARRQVVFAAVAIAVATAVLVLNATWLNVASCTLLVAAAWEAPLFIARQRESRRRRDLDLELSDSLGEMVMGVEAGLTLESVLNLYARRHRTPLGREFAYLLDRINLGTTRMVALEEFRDRNPTLGVQMFVSAVQQNQKLGTPLAEVLRQQGETARRRRRQAVEEDAAKLSLKMIFPTIFCILPVLLIVVVGPAIVRLVQSLPG